MIGMYLLVVPCSAYRRWETLGRLCLVVTKAAPSCEVANATKYATGTCTAVVFLP